MPKRHRNKIIMIKRDTPKRITLPNGRTFIARYKRVTRNEPPNKRRERRQQE